MGSDGYEVDILWNYPVIREGNGEVSLGSVHAAQESCPAGELCNVLNTFARTCPEDFDPWSIDNASTSALSSRRSSGTSTLPPATSLMRSHYDESFDATSVSVSSSSAVTSRRGSSRRSSGTSAFSAFSTSPSHACGRWLETGLDEEGGEEEALSCYNLFDGVSPELRKGGTEAVQVADEDASEIPRSGITTSKSETKGVMSLLFGSMCACGEEEIPLEGLSFQESVSSQRFGNESSWQYDGDCLLLDDDVGGSFVEEPISGAMSDKSLIEEMVFRNCHEILLEASNNSLKAVELANALRARIGTSILSEVRSEWGGLLFLLEKKPGMFQVERIPKSDVVMLVGLEMEKTSSNAVMEVAQNTQEDGCRVKSKSLARDRGEWKREFSIEESVNNSSMRKRDMKNKKYEKSQIHCDISDHRQESLYQKQQQQHHEKGKRRGKGQEKEVKIEKEIKGALPWQHRRHQRGQPKELQKGFYSRRLRLENLPPDLSELQLKRNLSVFGAIDSLSIAAQGKTRCAFATFCEIKDAMKAQTFLRTHGNILAKPVEVDAEECKRNSSTSKFHSALEILCDETYVPTQSWVCDLACDHTVVQTIVSILQQVGGCITISKLRGFLRHRLHSSGNISSFALKAFIVAYSDTFMLNCNIVSSAVGSNAKKNIKKRNASI